MKLPLSWALAALLAVPLASLGLPTPASEQARLVSTFNDVGTKQFLAELAEARAQGLLGDEGDAIKFLEIRALRINQRYEEARALQARMENEPGFISDAARATLGGLDGRTEEQAAEAIAQITEAHHNHYFQLSIEKADQFHLDFPNNWRRPEAEYRKINSVYLLNRSEEFYALSKAYLDDPFYAEFNKAMRDRLLFMRCCLMNLHGRPAEAMEEFDKMSADSEWRKEEPMVRLKAIFYSKEAVKEAISNPDVHQQYDDMIDRVLGDSLKDDKYLWFQEALAIAIRWRISSGRVDTLGPFVSRVLNSSWEAHPKSCEKALLWVADELLEQDRQADAVAVLNQLRDGLHVGGDALKAKLQDKISEIEKAGNQ